ncbi:MAG TPA: AAA family ATPase [Deltaproteobacteria bacterium]|nr:AAA family ATPase [Deltaproteobacteria bacterium]
MSSVLVEEAALSTSLNPFQATAAAYPGELASSREALAAGLPVLVECDKQLVPFFYRPLRDQLRADGFEVSYLDGRPRPDDPPGLGLMGRLLFHLAEAVRGAVEQRVLVLPHLDLVMGGAAGGTLSSEAREVVALLYENPTIVWLGFKDLTLSIPPVIQNLFPRKVHILGVPRDRLDRLVTQAEARKFGRGLHTFQLYRHVSGVNAVQLRRVLSAIDGEDYPTDPSPAWSQLRQSTLTSDIELPDIDLHNDIGGYESVKERLQQEIIDLARAHQEATTPGEARRIEGLIPRGIIFWGPPGTGKTLFAKAMARSLGAAVIVVSGPELKSRWVGQSEANLRRVFVAARRSAPAVIIFDELDSFASARGTYDGGAGVEHAMVNTLLTEMDGFRKNEMVFVVGTTNFVESLDPALMRPGRFEFKIRVPWPSDEDRREILKIYDRKMDLQLGEAGLEYAVKRSSDPVEGSTQPYSGDHIQAVCRALARARLRGRRTGPSTIAEIEAALTAHVDRPRLTPEEERVVAIHECGHAICALYCEHAPPIQRITIQGDLGGTLGMVRLEDPVNRYVMTRNQLLDRMCVSFGGRAAEQVLLDDLSAGAGSDLEQATRIARGMVELLGMGPEPKSYLVGKISDPTRAEVDAAVLQILRDSEARAIELVTSHRGELLALCDELLRHKTLDATSLSALKGRGVDG